MKALAWLAAIVVFLWIVLFLAAGSLTRRSAAREWPENLGRIEGVPKRYPDKETSASATELVRLGASLGVNLATRDKGDPSPFNNGPYEAVNTKLPPYLRAQLERSDDVIEEPPPEVATFLTTNDAAISAVRDHLIRSQTMTWKLRMGDGVGLLLPNLLGHMNLYRILVTRALESARRGDPSGWDDLHASWVLSRNLLERPDLISNLIAIAGARMTSAAAAKMPGSVPPWFAELRDFDYRHAMAASYQAETWLLLRTARQPGLKSLAYFLTMPYQRLCAADYIEHMRRNTALMMAMKTCAASATSSKTMPASMLPARWNTLGRIAMPNILGSWQRVTRFQVELERTDRVLRIRNGQTPAEASRCSDGKWVLGTSPVLRFSKEIAVPDEGTKYPLEYWK